ncbi:LacI family DNA-binding transcriptional regulator [Cryobacterium sp. TMT2-15-1]|uniref:LacI family DNA-binding transcriptional regulator n=1 Tax=Cryobacterium sp. TMT2-15-1 TaxID=1259246 RepID=UPI001F53EA14|nr:substrate-binding domain-containing protein [Cryobacterium sp. TMT2-15-1]
MSREPRPGGRSVRMIDVAKLAGVSQQTVSRVVNGHSNVGPEVRERVERAITQLRYNRNSAARALATNRSMNLGVVSYSLPVHGSALVLFGIAEEARRNGYATSLVSIPQVDSAGIRAALDTLVADAVDGIIVLAPMTAAVEVLRGLDHEVAIVRFEQGSPASSTAVSMNDALGARLATRHLLELGHETVWHVGGPPGWMASDARRTGWLAELAEHRRTVNPEFRTDDWTADSGYRAGLAIADAPSITAVLVANDSMALGVIKALAERGVQVPGDVSVVGFDDMSEARYFQPSLTTVRLDFNEVGRLAVERVLRLMGGEPAELIPVIQPELIVRGSTAPRRP